MVDVFISYARSGEAKARAMAQALEAAGLDVWWDDQLPTHRAYYEVLEERLREARAVLVLWSEEAAKSQWVRAEADMARSLDKLVQATVDGSLPPMPFNQIQCAQLKGWKGSAEHPEFRKVLASIEALTGSGGGAASEARPHGPSQRKPLWRNPFVLVAAGLVLAVAVGLFVYEAVTPGGGPLATEAASVAVLPFETGNGDAAAQAFAVALADDLGGVMSEYELRLLSQEQARTLNGPDRLARLKKLGARFALTGSVRREDGLIKVRANLLDVGSGRVLWTETFERKEADAAFLRVWIAYRSTNVATIASSTIGPGGFSPDPETVALTIKGDLAMGAEPATALRAMEQVAARAPNFAGGHSQYALALSLYALAAPPADGPVLWAKARQEADAAIRLNPLQSESAYGVRYILSRSEPPADLARSEDILLDGQKVSPSFAFMILVRCQLLLEAGRIREALSQCQQAGAMQPLHPAVTTERAVALLVDGQDDLARGTIDKLWREYPPDPQARSNRLIFNLFGGDQALAGAILRDPEQLPQSMDSSTVLALQTLIAARRSHSAGDIDKALQRIAAAVAKRQLDPAVQILAGAELGRPDTAFAALEAGNMVGTFGLPPMMMPQTASLRRDPRFWPWAKKVGLVDYWKARGVLPDFCSDPAAGVDCKAAMAKL